MAFGNYLMARLSSDNDRIAVTAIGLEEGGTAPQLWVKELPAGPMTRLTTDSGWTRRPVWSTDGRRISYVTDASGQYEARTIAADGSSTGAFDVLFQTERAVYEVVFTPDEGGLLFREGSVNEEEADIGFLDLTTDSVSKVLASDFTELNMALSPDGRWMAYVSDASGQAEVFVRPFPLVARSRVQVSTNGGVDPVWAHNGRELFFVGGDDWLSVAMYTAESTFLVQDRQRLFDTGPYYWEGAGSIGFDVAKDDERFLMVILAGGMVGSAEDEAPTFVYIQNFWEELKARVGN